MLRRHARDGHPGGAARARSTPTPTSSSAPRTPPAPSRSSWPRCFGIAIDCGATTINIPDTVGYALPLEFGDFIREQYRLCPSLHDVTVSVHCHNDLGLAVANSLAAVRAGAAQVECTVNGIGERAGNASLEEVVMALHTRGELLRLRHRHRHQEIARTQPPGQHADRLSDPAQQGHRRAQRLRPRIGHPPGRRARSRRPTRS